MAVDLTAMLTAGYFENGRDRGYMRPGLDCAATARPGLGWSSALPSSP